MCLNVFGPWIGQKIFWPAIRFELCTPYLQNSFFINYHGPKYHYLRYKKDKNYYFVSNTKFALGSSYLSLLLSNTRYLNVICKCLFPYANI